MSAGSGHVDRREWAAGLGFALLAVLVVTLIGRDLRPLPLYPDQASHPDAPAVYVTRLLPLEVWLPWPESAVRLRVPVWTDAARSPLDIEATLLARDGATPGPTVRARVTRAGLATLDAPPGSRGGTLRVRITSNGDSRETSPRVLWSAAPPRAPVETRYAGRPLSRVDVLPDTGPLLLVEHRWPARWLLLLWVLPLAATPLALGDPRRAVGVILLVALAASATSALVWQRDYTRRVVHYDADGYAQSARQLARYVTEPEARPEVTAWLHAHPHATTLAASALLAVPVALGAPVEVAYMLLCAAAGLLTLLLLLRSQRVDLGLDARLAFIGTVAFACHPSVLRSFARPSTDGIGLALVVATLAVLVRRFERAGWRSDLLLAALILVHPLARPQGLGYWPFIGLAALAAEGVRAGRWPSATAVMRTGIVLFAGPIVVLGLLTLLFGWTHNYALMLEKASRFRVNSTVPIFVASLLGTVQLLPLLWWPARTRLRDPRVALFAAWGLYAVALLVVVRAPYWLRHFEPALPAAYVLATVGLASLGVRARRMGEVLLGVMAAIGIAVTLWRVVDLAALPSGLAGLVSSP